MTVPTNVTSRKLLVKRREKQEGPLTPQRGVATLRPLLAVLKHNSPKGVVDEADLSAESSAPPARTWLPRADEDPRGPCRFEAAPCQGAPTACCDHTVEVAVDRQAGRFQRADRLLRRQEFRYVTRHGRRGRTQGFVVVAVLRQEESPDRRVRLGVTVSRRVGKAVVRNQVKRRIRAWFRHKRPQMRANLDIVVIAQQAAAVLSPRDTISALEEGAQSAGVVA